MGADIRVDGKTARGARRAAALGRAGDGDRSARQRLPRAGGARRRRTPARCRASTTSIAATSGSRRSSRASAPTSRGCGRERDATSLLDRADARARLRAPPRAARGARRAGVGRRSSARCARSSTACGGAATPRSSRTPRASTASTLTPRTVEVPARGDGARPRRRCRADVRRALRLAARRITAFHRRQRQGSWSFRDATGARLGQQVRALDRVGVYVPGGTAAYPSSVLDERHPGQGRGRRRGDRRDAGRPRRRAGRGARRGAHRRHRSPLPRRRRAGGRGARLRHALDPARRQDLRPRQHLGRDRQAARLRRRRHRHDRRSERGADRRRRAAPTRSSSPPICSRRPSTIRSRRRSW